MDCQANRILLHVEVRSPVEVEGMMISYHDIMPVTRSEYSISDDERDSVIMAIRKHIEDWPGENIRSVRWIAEHSGVAVEKVKLIMFALLHSGELVCESVGDGGSIHFKGNSLLPGNFIL